MEFRAAGFYQSRSRAAYWDGRNDLGRAGFQWGLFLPIVHPLGASGEADGYCEVSGARCPAYGGKVRDESKVRCSAYRRYSLLPSAGET